MKNRSIALLFLGWCFHVALSEDLLPLEDMEESGDDLEYSGSGDWSGSGWEMSGDWSGSGWEMSGDWSGSGWEMSGDWSGERSKTSRPLSKAERVGLKHSPYHSEGITTLPEVVTTPSHKQAQSQGPGTYNGIVMDEKLGILGKQQTTRPPAEAEDAGRAAVTLLATPQNNEGDPRQPYEEEAEPGDGSLEDSTQSSITTKTVREPDSVLVIVDEGTIPRSWANDTSSDMPDDSDLTFDPTPESTVSSVGDSEKSRSLLERKEVLAGMVGAGVVGLFVALALVVLMVRRIRKKPEGNYAQGGDGSSYRGYQRAPTQEEVVK